MAAKVAMCRAVPFTSSGPILLTFFCGGHGVEAGLSARGLCCALAVGGKGRSATLGQCANVHRKRVFVLCECICATVRVCVCEFPCCFAFVYIAANEWVHVHVRASTALLSERVFLVLRARSTVPAHYIT